MVTIKCKGYLLKANCVSESIKSILDVDLFFSLFDNMQWII